MSLFGKLKPPPWDPAEGNPHVRPALQLLEAQDWRAMSDLYRSLGPSDRTHMIRGLGALSILDRDLPMESDDPAIGSIIGGIRVEWAWRHRGGSRANEVSARAFDGMRRCLLAADPMLEAAGEAAQEDTAIIASHIRCEMGLGGNYGMLTKLTNRLSRSREGNVFAAFAHLNFVTPKWHGSVEQMWVTANAYASKPRNAAWITLAARAHIEEWLYSYVFGGDQDLRFAYAEKLADPGFRDFMGAIDRQFWETLETGGPMSGSETIFAHNNMAGALVMVDAIDLSRRHFDSMGPYIADQPLGYFSTAENMMESLNHWRRRASLPPLKGSRLE